MAIRTVLNGGYQTYEYQKFVEILNDSNFPPVTAYWENDLSNKTQVFPKTAILTYDIGQAAINALPFGDNSSIDAFGRLRVSTPTSIFSAKQLYSKRDFIYDEFASGTGGCLFSSPDAGTILYTTNANDYVIRQTFQSFGYQPGKSQQFLFTGVLSGGDDIDMLYGPFKSGTSPDYSDYNGLYFKVSDNNISVNISNTFGNNSSVSVPQSAWNLDKFDGTGPSGFVLDITKIQIFTIDFEWLGSGRVRFGFNEDGHTFYCHEHLNANVDSSVFIQNPNLPIRAEIRQNGATPGRLLHICANVNSEGGVQNQGSLRSIDTALETNNTPISIPVKTECSIMVLQLSSTRLDAVVTPQDFSVVNTDANIDSRIRIIRNPSYTGNFTLSSIQDSAIAYGVGGSGFEYISGGQVLSTYFVSKDDAANLSTLKESFVSMGHSIEGVSDEYHIFVTPLKSGSGSGLYYASANWLEDA
jgi:hypothetical protein